MTDQPEFLTVEFSVKHIEPVHGRGALVALAVVDLDVAGVALTLQGVQVVEVPGGLACKSPVWRHPSRGTWLPGVLLPAELADAMAAEVLTTWRATAARQAVSYPAMPDNGLKTAS